MSEQRQAGFDVKVHPPVVYGGTLLGGLLLQKVFPVSLLPRKAARIAGLPLVIVGMALGFAAVATMYRAKTSVRPGDPVSALVETGPFHFTRNPIYVGLTSLYAGIATITNSLWALLMLPMVLLVIDREMIHREEDFLERQFGERYLEYKQRVPRWL